MQHSLQHVGEWLQKEWFLGVILAVNGLNGLRAWRGARRSLRERDAVNWPAMEGIARCRTVPTGVGQSSVHVRAVPLDGSEAVFSAHAFSNWEEAEHCSAALDGRTVRIHVNPKEPEERIVCWPELRRMVPAFVLPDGGRLSSAAFRWVRAFQVVVLAASALLLTDVGLFATPWGRNAEWRGMCLCDASIGLLLLSGVLLLPAQVLRRRINAVSREADGQGLRQATRWVTLVSVGAWAGMLFFSAVHHGEPPDAVFYGLITLPVFPLLWWSGVAGVRAEVTLRPSGSEDTQQPAVQIRPEAAEGPGLVEAGGLR